MGRKVQAAHMAVAETGVSVRTHACVYGSGGVSRQEVKAMRSGEGCQKVVTGVSTVSLSLVACGKLLDLPRESPLPLSLNSSVFQMHLLFRL